MIKQNKNKKLQEELVKMQIETVDKTFIQDELIEMQSAIQFIVDDLNAIDLDETDAQVICELNDVCNTILDKINNYIQAYLRGGV